MSVGGVFLPLVFAAGVVSFVSPCVLPLVPGYLSAVAAAGDPTAGARRTLRPSLLFMVGFLLVFLALGATASTLGQALATHRTVFNTVAGGFVVVMGLVMVAGVTLPATGLGHAGLVAHRVATARGGPVALGVAFAFCWTPCIGPVLASILVLAGSAATLDQGVLLLLVYGLGLAVPFLLASLAFTRAMRAFRSLRRWYRGFQVIAGATLVGMGLLLVTDRLWMVNAYAQRVLTSLGLDWWQSL
jgi:cytochrome c-type biogenesis protein